VENQARLLMEDVVEEFSLICNVKVFPFKIFSIFVKIFSIFALPLLQVPVLVPVPVSVEDIEPNLLVSFRSQNEIISL
jgi:hypothetical protein